jgi:hypothetical protein
MQFLKQKDKNVEKDKTKPNQKTSFIAKYQKRYVDIIENNVFKEKEIETYNRLKFISVTASDNNPAENIKRYILRSFALYLLSPIFIIFAVLISIISFAFGMPSMSLFGLIFGAIGAFEMLKPYSFFKFLVNSDFSALEKGLYNSRFELIRIMYNNFILYGNSLYIDERVKLNKYIYTYFTFLNYQSGVSYDRIINSSLFFTDLDLVKFLKDIGVYMRDQNIVVFYQKKEDELRIKEEAIVSDRATTFASIITLMLFGTGMLGLLLGIGSTIQPVIIQIYNNIMKNFNSAMVSQISSELSLFQMIVSIPPLYYFYVFLFIFSLISLFIMVKLSKRMVIM